MDTDPFFYPFSDHHGGGIAKVFMVRLSIFRNRLTRGSTSAWAGFLSIHEFNCILLVEARSNELSDYRGFPDAILIAGDNVLINRVTGVQGLFNVIGFHLGSSP